LLVDISQLSVKENIKPFTSKIWGPQGTVNSGSGDEEIVYMDIC
jgi:hypothetical protein